jgi:hypothetical protein
MNDWALHLVDYWDQTTGAINRNVLRLIRLSEPERKAAYGQIQNAVFRRLHALSDIRLLQATVSMVDDLYKYVNDEVLVDQALFAYLDAFAGAFTRVVRERGYAVHYVVENQFLMLTSSCAARLICFLRCSTPRASSTCALTNLPCI